MKSIVRFVGIIALAAVIAFTMTACGDGGGGGGGGTQNLGESNPFIGTWSGTVTSIDGTAAATLVFTDTRWTLTAPDAGINETGTYTHQGNNATFLFQGQTVTATISGGTLTVIAPGIGTGSFTKSGTGGTGGGKQYSTIELLAYRWDGREGQSGEHWGNSTAVKLSDFSNVKPQKLDTLRFKISGKSDKALDGFQITLVHMTGDDWSTYRWLGGSEYTRLPTNFSDTIIEVKIWGELIPNAPIRLHISNELWAKDASGNYTHNTGLSLGNTPNDTLMATITNFKISLVVDDNNGGGTAKTLVITGVPAEVYETLFIDNWLTLLGLFPVGTTWEQAGSDYAVARRIAKP